MVGQVVYQLFDVWVEVLSGIGIIFKFLIDLFWIEYVVCVFFCGFVCVYNVGYFDGCLVLGWQWQMNGVQFVFWEIFDVVMGIMEQYVVGVVVVYQY